MFNDKFCLTQAVLDGTKTMTRRKLSMTLDKEIDGKLIRVYPSRVFFDNGKWNFDFEGRTYFLPMENYPRYQVGEVVAIAQPYRDVVHNNAEMNDILIDNDGLPCAEYKSGWNNKMFTRADLMIHHIKITDVRIERLQEISDEDCMREGIKFVGELRADGYNDYYFSCRPTPKHPDNNMIGYFTSPCEAYAVLIDKINGKGTWGRNPFVFVYEFELVGKTKL